MPAARDWLRILTCGSVDDGKSTLIGRLLLETGSVPDDQRATLERDSRRFGTTGDALDPALLLDGLQAEREQGITIDVAYRQFRTGKRSFIVADTPGHEQYTRNMVTGASTADLAILLVDARQGLLTQTRRHAFLCLLLGIRQIVLAVNKIDTLAHSQAEPVFRATAAAGLRLLGELTEFGAGHATLLAIPLSARDGDNVARRSTRTPWYAGPPLLEHLETVPVDAAGAASPFRFPVQLVARPDPAFRGFAGTVAGGSVRPGDPVVVASSGIESRIARIIAPAGGPVGESAGKSTQDLAEAVEGDAVTLCLTDQVDVSRGDLLVDPQARPIRSDRFVATLVWLGDEPLLPGRSYLLKCATMTVPAGVTTLRHRIDVGNLARQPAAESLALNEIGSVEIATDQPIAFDPYRQNRTTGSFILIDRLSNATVGAGLIEQPLARARNLAWTTLDVGKSFRAEAKGQRPCIVWFTGLSGAGKSTIANLVDRRLAAEGRHTYLLDGDNVRHGLNSDLGFGAADRVENIRRIAEVARLFVEAGLIVLVAFISPFRAERALARRLVSEDEFLEIFVDTPIAVCRSRDRKGLYARADRGDLPDFTGVSSPYEPPEAPDLHLRAEDATPEELAEQVAALLAETGRLRR